jgi:hypothetical protein
LTRRSICETVRQEWGPRCVLGASFMYRASGNGGASSGQLSGQQGYGAVGSLSAALASSSAPAHSYAATSSYGASSGTLQRRAGDESLADLFKTMRAIHNVSQSEMARRLGTDVGVVLDFEAGLIDALPPWPVTAAIVERYAALAALDPSPILSHLLRQQSPLQASAMGITRNPAHQIAQQPRLALPVYVPQAHAAPPPQAHHSAYETAPQQARPALAPPRNDGERPVGFEARTKQRATTGRDATPRSAPSDATANAAAKAPVDIKARRRRRVRRTVASVVPLGLIAAVFALVQLAPKPLYAAARMMPAPLDEPMRQLVDLVVYQTAPVRDGLRWIDAGDPRVRKGDRLKTR